MSGPNDAKLVAERDAYKAEVAQLKAEVERLEKALEFYALESSWDRTLGYRPDGDTGETARKALKW